MSSSTSRKRHVTDSPHQGTLRRTLSNRTASNTPGNTTPQHHVGRKYGKENREQTKRSSSTTGTGSATQPLEADATVFKTPTRTVKSAALKNTGTPECYNKVEMCMSTPGRLSRPSSDDNEIDNDGFSVMVAVRVRPFNKREETESDVTRVVSMSGNETTVTTSRGAGINSFCFDHCFWSFDDKNAPFATQQMVYEKVGQPLLYSALEGYHTCLFAYGQTGSGKSYTMMGDSDAKGIIPRFCEELFSKIAKPEEENVKFMVEVSFFEIYNEKIHDLLSDANEKDQKKATLRVREHPSLGPYVEGLSVYRVHTFSDISRWIRAGNKQRATAATGMNDASSRSHSVFMIVLTKSKSEFFEDGEHVNSVSSKINLIDLAGSERSSTAQTSGDRLKEGANINKSLMTLGKVISNLSEKSLNPKKKVFIPYRESVLTWLLKESLGGNSKTAMIATISPASTNSEETMSTLRYAKQAESIINIPKVNEDPNARLVRELRGEIERLRLITKGSYNKQLDLDKIKNCQPNLVNLDENPQNEEVLVYLLKNGKNRICAETSASEGEESEEEKNQYCMVENANKLYCVKPGNAFQTLVNGREVRRQTFLNHGDRLIVGNSYFRFNHPEEVRKRRKRKATSQSEDKGGIKFARNEIIEDQKRRMEEEISKMKQEMEAEMEKKIKSIKKSSNEEAQEQCKQAEKQVADLQMKINEFQREIQMMQSQKRELESRSASLMKEKTNEFQREIQMMQSQKRELESRSSSLMKEKTNEFQKEIQMMQSQKRELESRSACLMKEKTVLLQQLQNVKNLFQTTMMPVIGVQRRMSSYRPKILEEMEKEKDRMTQFIHNMPRKRIPEPCTGGPVSKRRKSGPEVRLAPVEEACLTHLKTKDTVSLDSTNILDNILLEMGKMHQTLSCFKEEGGPPCSASLIQVVASCDVMMSLVSVWCNLYPEGKEPVLSTLRYTCQKSKQQLQVLLESHQEQAEGVTAKNFSKYNQTLLFMVKLIGELNARIGKTLKILRREDNESCHWTMKQALVTGGDTAVDRYLQSGLQDVADLGRKLQDKLKSHYSSENTRNVLQCAVLMAKSFAVLLHKCQETQFELASVLACQDPRNSSFYLQSYERALSLTTNVRQGVAELKKIAGLLLAASHDNTLNQVLDSTNHLHTVISTLGLSASTQDLLPTGSQTDLTASSLESSTSSNNQPYKPSELALLASRQAASSCQNLKRVLLGRQSSNDDDDDEGDEDDEVFVDAREDARHVHFKELTSKDVFLVTKYSENQNEIGTSID